MGMNFGGKGHTPNPKKEQRVFINWDGWTYLNQWFVFDGFIHKTYYCGPVSIQVKKEK